MNEQVKWFGTLRGRLGWIPTDPLLLYATGGLAYGNVTDNLSVATTPFPGVGSQPGGGFSYACRNPGPPSCFLGSSSQTLVGWTAGVGGEYMLMRNLTVKAEYLYVNLGRLSDVAVAQGTLGGTTPSSFAANFGDVTFSVARVGVNLKF